MEKSTRTGIFILITLYLISIFFILGAMSETINDIDYKSTDGVLGGTVNFLGMEIGIADNFFGSFVISITTLPIWFNSIFIVLPFTLWTIFGILMLIPTMPSG